MLVSTVTLFSCILSVRAADQVVQAGSVTFSAESPHPRVSLRGTIDNVDTVFDDGVFEAATCRPCTAGSHVPIGAFISAVGRGANHFIVGKDFNFVAPAVQIPADAAADVTLTAPFEFSGSIAFSNARDPQPEEPSPSVWTGSGTATLHLSSIVDSSSGGRLYFFKDMSYQFSPERR
jgi:hypothetical protein